MILLPRFIARLFTGRTPPKPDSGESIPRVEDPFINFDLVKEAIKREAECWRFFKASRIRRRLRAAWSDALAEHEKIISKAIIRDDRRAWLDRRGRDY
jgi:hypothetical protein